MNKKALGILILFLIRISLTVSADEGMWLPLLISKYNMADMQKMGCKLSAEQIYSVNQACLKDAVVSLDHGGCTGSIISAKGLLITNHHCGFEDIAGQSSVEKDYLTQGFWAMRPEEELPIPGKTVSFLVRMEDVTGIILSGITDEMNSEDRSRHISGIKDSLERNAISDTHLEASIESMFEGNEFYLFVYETYKDIRMVGAPPSGIGKFGGETDNWMWPRHTGDFCLLRVYASSDGKPAEYAKDNIPCNGRHFLPVSLDGISEGDFTLIMGYPGATDRYLTSFGIRQKLEQLNPADILLKTSKMEILSKYMKSSDALRIAFAGDYAYLANFQKKSIQESKALKRLRVYDDKQETERDFLAWIEQDENRKAKYGNVLSNLEEVYLSKQEDQADVAMIYLQETMMGVKLLLWAYQAGELAAELEDGRLDEEQKRYFAEKAWEFYKNYDASADRELMEKMFSLYRDNLPEQFHPEIMALIDRKYRSDLRKYSHDVYENSLFATEQRFLEFLQHPKLKKLYKDPAYRAAGSFYPSYILTRSVQMLSEDKFNEARRKLILGLHEMNHGKAFYPDANSTMRLTYGQVRPYEPADAVKYHFLTSGAGILQKEDPGSQEFKVPAQLIKLLQEQDYGIYGENGHLPVCFLTTHDITGGNSGSPVMNADGELIGVAFDGNSEAMSSDIKYDVKLQRTICVDIRYVLFVIDKFAGAGYLLDEMKLTGGKKRL